MRCWLTSEQLNVKSKRLQYSYLAVQTFVYHNWLTRFNLISCMELVVCMKSDYVLFIASASAQIYADAYVCIPHSIKNPIKESRMIIACGLYKVLR